MTDHAPTPEKRRAPFLLKVVAVFVMATLAAGVGAFAAFAKLDGEKIVRGVSIADTDVSLLTPEQAFAAISARAETMQLAFKLDDKLVAVEPDEMRLIASFDVQKAVDAAHAIGREKSPTVAVASRLRAAFIGRTIAVPHTFDRVALRQSLEAHYAEEVAPAKNAGFAVTFTDGTPAVAVVDEVGGVAVNYDAVMRTADARLSALSVERIDMPTKRDQPALDANDVEPLTAAVAAAVKRAPFTLKAKTETWVVTRATFADWIIAAPGEAAGDAPRLALDRTKVGEFLESRATAIRTEPIDAYFEEKDGEVIKFTAGKNGETVDTEGSAAALENLAFISTQEVTPLELPLTAVEPDITTEESNPYGIKEIIGVGATNFRGSPANRRHNIAVGATSVNGTIIAPDEEFSMIKTLGVIDGTTGYKQELVIKDNRTTPEYGGGLCQIGSTAFRAALASGLPITMRKNHSYRVPYYERDGDGNDIGPGKDATIYDPLPDFRFLNDTGHHIMIITSIEGNKVSFTFWGVSDGRKAEQTRARVYNIVQPPPKKIIQTTDIPVGTTKCTESAHVGSDAVFSYKVTMANGEVRDKDFVSHYRPWQEVCLEGVDASALPPGVTSQEKITSPDSAAADAPENAAPPTTPAPAPAPAPVTPAPATP